MIGKLHIDLLWKLSDPNLEELYSFKFLYLIPTHRQDKAKGVEILVGDLKVFSTFNEELYKEITQLLTLNDFRYFSLSLSYIGYLAMFDIII